MDSFEASPLVIQLRRTCSCSPTHNRVPSRRDAQRYYNKQCRDEYNGEKKSTRWRRRNRRCTKAGTPSTGVWLTITGCPDWLAALGGKQREPGDLQ